MRTKSMLPNIVDEFKNGTLLFSVTPFSMIKYLLKTVLPNANVLHNESFADPLALQTYRLGDMTLNTLTWELNGETNYRSFWYICYQYYNSTSKKLMSFISMSDYVLD